MTTLRFAVRRLIQRPGFAAVATGTLALGIGVNAAIFSLVQAVLLRPPPFPSPGRLVQVRGFDREANEADNLSPADFLDFARETRSFSGMGANGYVGSFTVAGAAGDAERVGGVNVTAGFFPTLGVEAALGRTFVPEDDRPDAPATVVLSDGFWRRRFAGNPGVVGSPVLLNARPTTIIGVLPAWYRHIEENPDRPADVFAPYQFNTAEPNRGGHFIRAVGRLAPGSSLQGARAELETIAARLEQEYPTSNHERGVYLQSLHNAVVGDARPSLVLLAASVGLVLLIACANLANLLLAAGAARQRELAVRAALGASRRRLVEQLLVESLVLSALGALAGIAIGWWATRAFGAIRRAGIPRVADAGIDGGVLAFVATIAVGAALVFGLVPALQMSRDVLHDALKEGGRHGFGGVRRGARQVFIAVQVALALVLLVGGTLLIRSVWALEGVAPGFSAVQVLAMDVSLPTATYAEGEEIPFYERLESRVGTLPGVTAVGAVNILPLSGDYDSRGIQIEDRPRPDGQGESPQARSVTQGYFKAMGIPLVAGRLFDGHDIEGAPRVVVVSESMARRYWPGENPVGKRITFNSGIPRAEQQVVGGPGSREVVGLVGNVRHLGLDEDDVPMFYTPHAQQPSYHTMTLVVRAAGAVEGLPAAARSALREMDPSVPLYQVRSLEQVLSRAVAEPRLRAVLLALFAALAAALASLGVYGVVSYLVSQRSHEFGIRISLGATAADIVRLVMGEGLRPVLAGLAMGVAGAWALGRTIESLLFGVSTADPLSYAAAFALLATSALAATLIPARRVLRVDPTVAFWEQQ
ncbi:MAG: ABC transporter permease [Acidobacteria bacterium]|nr:ABC transporter permease [Acidobacteriota bacterium]